MVLWLHIKKVNCFVKALYISDKSNFAFLVCINKNLLKILKCMSSPGRFTWEQRPLQDKLYLTGNCKHLVHRESFFSSALVKLCRLASKKCFLCMYQFFNHLYCYIWNCIYSELTAKIQFGAKLWTVLKLRWNFEAECLKIPILVQL